MQNLFGKQEGAKNIGNHLSIIIYHHNAPMDLKNMLEQLDSMEKSQSPYSFNKVRGQS